MGSIWAGSTMDVGADGVAIIAICNPPVNALHPASKAHYSLQLSHSLLFGSVSLEAWTDHWRALLRRFLRGDTDAVFDGLSEMYGGDSAVSSVSLLLRDSGLWDRDDFRFGYRFRRASAVL